jgi:ribosomal protein L4
VVLDAEEADAQKSFRNINKVTVLPATAVGVADILGAASVVASEPALEVLKARAAEVGRGNAGPAEPEAPAEDSVGGDS